LKFLICKNFQIPVLEHKHCKGLLDYDDLIIQTNNLLNSSDFKDWVLYKLDGGIDHLLVDEAQDTSSSQWKIIEALIEEFYSGDSAQKEKNNNRTVFVVGDEKQSIFSFQGANVASFSYMNQLLKDRMQSAGKEFEDINLETSYRSTKEVLHVVHEVFRSVKRQTPNLFTAVLQNLIPHRASHSGIVELWPICTPDQSENSFWSIASESLHTNSAKLLLAKKIASYIRDQIATGKIIPSTGKKYPQEIL